MAFGETSPLMVCFIFVLLLCVARQTDGDLHTASSLSGVFRVADNNNGENIITPSISTHARRRRSVAGAQHFSFTFGVARPITHRDDLL